METHTVVQISASWGKADILCSELLNLIGMYFSKLTFRHLPSRNLSMKRKFLRKNMKRYLLIASAVFISTVVISPTAHAKDIMYILQSRAGMPEIKTPKTIPYRYTMHVSLSELDSDGARDVQAEIRVDPSKPAGSRTRIVRSTNGHRKTLIEFLKKIEDPELDTTERANDFWCAAIHENEDVDLSEFTVMSETDHEAILKPNPEILSELLIERKSEDMDKSQKKMKKKLLDRIDGNVVVSKRNGSTKGYQVAMTRSTKFKTIVKIKSLSIEQSCDVAPNGHQFKSKKRVLLRGSAMGGIFWSDANIRITDLTPIPK